MPTPLLQVRDLRVSFSRDGKWAEAVHGIDLDVMAGRTLGLVGESGSGKSVSSLAVMRLLNEKISRISAGSILLDGTEIKDYTENQMADVRGKRIAMIFQEPMTSLNPVYKCGFQVSEMILQHEKVSKKAARERGIGSWMTSALESNIGLNAIAQLCSALYGDNITMPQGLGTGQLFTDNIPMALEIRGDQLWISRNS